MTAQDILKQYFGYDSFRPGQDELVRAILSGRDTLGIMPTGAGKSICYQVPAMLFPGLTLVISPLISLMKDQVGALVEAGVPAACINSAMSAEEFRDALYFAGRGQYKLLYVAPERLTAPSFLEFAQRVPISMPARGVKPIEVSSTLPSLTAEMDEPLPRWQVTILVPSALPPSSLMHSPET